MNLPVYFRKTFGCFPITPAYPKVNLLNDISEKRAKDLEISFIYLIFAQNIKNGSICVL